MTDWPGWLVALACGGYMIVVAIASAVWKYWRALANVRRRGFEPERLYVAIHPRLWWYALLVLPPLVLVAAWVSARPGA